MIREAIKKMSDNKLDQELKGLDILTFKYNVEAVMDIGKSTTVWVNSDKSNFHIIKPNKEMKKDLDKKIDQYNLVLIDGEI